MRVRALTRAFILVLCSAGPAFAQAPAATAAELEGHRQCRPRRSLDTDKHKPPSPPCTKTTRSGGVNLVQGSEGLLSPRTSPRVSFTANRRDRFQRSHQYRLTQRFYVRSARRHTVPEGRVQGEQPRLPPRAGYSTAGLLPAGRNPRQPSSRVVDGSAKRSWRLGEKSRLVDVDAFRRAGRRKNSATRLTNTLTQTFIGLWKTDGPLRGRVICVRSQHRRVHVDADAAQEVGRTSTQTIKTTVATIHKNDVAVLMAAPRATAAPGTRRGYFNPNHAAVTQTGSPPSAT